MNTTELDSRIISTFYENSALSLFYNISNLLKLWMVPTLIFISSLLYS